MSGVGVCQRVARRPAATTVFSRSLGVVDNLSEVATRTRVRSAMFTDHDNRTACVSFQFHRNAIAAATTAAAAAAARCEAAAV